MRDKPAMSAIEIRRAVAEWAALGFSIKVDAKTGLIDVMPPQVMVKEASAVQPVDLIQWGKR
ncbi:hypothetical protein [Paracoccus sp. PAR01]|uniref:hypothetical protein n=1 Tax=Paracoccus sp. PAR01 TaxID=2769282 RepID=UPI001783150A|nr:hypothetical protein [Paracoccus sp. PAR01]MBD9528413.1 hypothetical protein [Paracoccus sp. PAR01]